MLMCLYLSLSEEEVVVVVVVALMIDFESEIARCAWCHHYGSFVEACVVRNEHYYPC